MNIKITRKKIKNIIIKIAPNGDVLISAPQRVPVTYIKNIVSEKENWIRKKIEEVKQKQEKLQYQSQNIFTYLGKSYPIEIIFSKEEKCELLNSKFIIYTETNSTQKRQSLILQWLEENFSPILKELNENIGKKIGYFPTSIKIRDMKTRWGSCNTLKKTITYNLKLYEKPLEVIEYVVLHELAHIPYPHHQKSFWDFVEKYMPDWKLRRKALKN